MGRRCESRRSSGSNPQLFAPKSAALTTAPRDTREERTRWYSHGVIHWRGFRRVGLLIGYSHDGQIHVCQLVAMVIWSWTSNVPVGWTPTDTIAPRSRSRLSPRYVLVVLKWRKNRSVFKARRVFSFDIVQVTHFYVRPTDEHNREAFACESDHSRLATIIVDVPVDVENLPVVRMAYNGILR